MKSPVSIDGPTAFLNVQFSPYLKRVMVYKTTRRVLATALRR